MASAATRRPARIAAMLAVVTVTAAFAATSAAAQDSAHAETTRAFDSLDVVLRGVANTNRNTFHRFWEPGPGLELGIEMPFYLGRLELGGQLMDFSARTAAQPDFFSSFLFGGWGLETALPLATRGYAGLRIGSFLTRFDADVSRETRNEQEIAWGLHSRVRRRIGGAWQAEASIRYRVVLTRHRIRHVFLAVGVGRSFSTPEWLKDFLR